jgi:hypothetical protein
LKVNLYLFQVKPVLPLEFHVLLFGRLGQYLLDSRLEEILTVVGMDQQYRIPPLPVPAIKSMAMAV